MIEYQNSNWYTILYVYTCNTYVHPQNYPCSIIKSRYKRKGSVETGSVFCKHALEEQKTKQSDISALKVLRSSQSPVLSNLFCNGFFLALRLLIFPNKLIQTVYSMNIHIHCIYKLYTLAVGSSTKLPSDENVTAGFNWPPEWWPVA